MISSFTKENLKQIRKELNDILDKYSNSKGLGKIELGTIRFDLDQFSCKLTTSIKNPSTKLVVMDPFHVKVGDKFKRKRTIYTVTSTNNSGMFKFSVRTQTGKNYKVKPDQLVKLEKVN